MGFCCCCTRARSILHVCLFFAMAAFALSILTVMSCRFFESQSGNGNQQAYGLYRFSYRHDFCVNYNDLRLYDFDPSSSTVAARAFSVLACIFGGCALIALFLMQCIVTPSPKTWRSTAFLLMFAFMSQSLSFLIMVQANDELCALKDVECDIGIGGILGVCATCLYLIVAVAACAIPAPQEPAYDCPLVVKCIKTTFHWTGIHRKRGPWKTRLPTLYQSCSLICGLICITFSLAVVFSCRFYQVELFSPNNDGGGPTIKRTLRFGLYGYFYPPEDSCRYYEYGDRRHFHTSTKAAQTFSVLAVIFGGILTLMIWTMVFMFTFRSRTYKCLPIWAFLACLVQGLTFLVFKEANDRICRFNDTSCAITTDGILSAVATGLYFCLIPATYLWFQQEMVGEDQEEYMEDEVVKQLEEDEEEEEEEKPAESFVDDEEQEVGESMEEEQDEHFEEENVERDDEGP